MRVPLMRARRRGQEHGAAAAFIAILTTVLIGTLAFVTDYGLAYVHERGLQNGADAAALAVAQKIALEGGPTASCSQLAATYQAQGQAIAADYVSKNRTASDASLSSFGISCNASGTMLIVDVATSQDSPTFFGGILGKDGVDLAQNAKAVVTPAATVVGLRPFAVCKGVALQAIASPTINHTVRLDNTSFGCGSASGNWGIMDFNGGSNSTGEIADWILNGYDGPISNNPPVYLPGNPGAPNPGALDAEMDWLMGKEIVIPVYDQLTGNGQNSQFRIMGFLSLRMCGYKFQNKRGQGACFSQLVVPVPEPQNYLQIRYTGYSALGDAGTTCVIGNIECDLGTRLFKLAD